jgi:hypothetical protein
MSIASLLIPLSCRPRSTFLRKPAWNCLRSKRADTRVKMSCEGIPLGNSRNVRNQSSCAWPNSSPSYHLSDPAMTAQIAMTKYPRAFAASFDPPAVRSSRQRVVRWLIERRPV